MTKRAASLFIGLCLLTVATHSASAQTDECGRMRNARREAENQMMALLESCPFGQYWNSVREQCVKIGE